MTKSSIVQARIEPKLKDDVDHILASIGLNATTAITLLYTQISHHRGLPFEVKIPNDETLKAMRKARDPEFRKNAKSYSTAQELFDDIDS